MIKIHPSSLSKIMTMAKGKTNGPEVLSVGALTHCYDLAKQFVYNYYPEINSKYLDKGNLCENDSIALYNSVYGTNHRKNETRKENEYLSGECDIEDNDIIVDIKTSWSLVQFPALPHQAHDPDYEWQGRAYMILWDKPKFRLSFCLVSTPEDLIKYEDENLHYVDLIDPRLRVTSVDYERDEDKDKLIEIKCRAAQAQAEIYIEAITNKYLAY